MSHANSLISVPLVCGNENYHHAFFTGRIKRANVEFDGPVVPVVLAFIVCDYAYEEWDGNLKTVPGRHVLFIRRSFDVGAMPGLWSVVAGVHDVDPEANYPLSEKLGLENSLRIKVAEEVAEETGWIINKDSTIIKIGELEIQDPDNPNRIFKKMVHVVNFHLKSGQVTPRVSLDYESAGKTWVPMNSIAEYKRLGKTDNLAFNQILKDGVTPDFHDNLALLLG